MANQMNPNVAAELSDLINESDSKEAQAIANKNGFGIEPMQQMNTSSIRTTYSYYLPNEEENIFSAIILSRWDDIMGPQTVHVWFQKIMEESSNSSLTNDSTIPVLHPETREEHPLIKSINYISAHTVNYGGGNLSDSHKEPSSSTFFVVPDLNFISQALLFRINNHGIENAYSVAVLIPYKHHTYYLNYFDLVLFWLGKLSINVQISKNMICNQLENDEICNNILNLCQSIISIRTFPLHTFTISNTQEFLKRPLLAKALTSHLQTSGCSVIFGLKCNEINLMIEFLALFLTKEEKLCSKLTKDNDFSFQSGLYLQGLLLDQFGCRGFQSEDLENNPYPVTTIDLTNDKISGVKQTLLHHIMKKKSQFQYSTKKRKDNSLLYPIRNSSQMVQNFLEDLSNLPLDKWSDFIQIFKKKIYLISKTMFNLVNLFKTNCQIKESLLSYLCRLLNLTEEDILIVLATAEKMQTGISTFIMQKYIAR